MTVEDFMGMRVGDQFFLKGQFDAGVWTVTLTADKLSGMRFYARPTRPGTDGRSSKPAKADLGIRFFPEDAPPFVRYIPKEDRSKK